MSIPSPSRRALIASAAWTAPAVIVAGAAPAFASSALDLSVGLQAVEKAGGDWWEIVVTCTITNLSSAASGPFSVTLENIPQAASVPPASILAHNSDGMWNIATSGAGTLVAQYTGPSFSSGDNPSALVATWDAWDDLRASGGTDFRATLTADGEGPGAGANNQVLITYTRPLA